MVILTSQLRYHLKWGKYFDNYSGHVELFQNNDLMSFWSDVFLISLIFFSFQGNNIFQSLSPQEYRTAIKMLEHAILSTDLALYFKYVDWPASDCCALLLEVTFMDGTGRHLSIFLAPLIMSELKAHVNYCNPSSSFIHRAFIRPHFHLRMME